MRFRNILFSLYLLTGAILGFTSCGPVYPPTTNVQYRHYLEGLPKSRPGPNPIAHDSDSYWDGGHSDLPARIVIDLSEQRAYFYRGPHLVGRTRVSTGTPERQTPPGNFKVTEKDIDHRSNLYGDFVDDNGNVIVKDIGIKEDIPPPGTKFLGAAMFNFLRFNNGIGMHTGFLPGYAASHGCVRMPDHMAKHFYRNAKIGTPVIVQP